MEGAAIHFNSWLVNVKKGLDEDDLVALIDERLHGKGDPLICALRNENLVVGVNGPAKEVLAVPCRESLEVHVA